MLNETVIGYLVKWHGMHVYLTAKFQLMQQGPEVEISVRAEILLPKKHRFVKTSFFKYQRESMDLRGFLHKCKVDAVHDLKNELLVSAFGHEVRMAEVKLAGLQVIHAKARQELAQGIIDG